MVNFCPKCDKILKKKKEGEDIFLVCPACGHKEPYSDSEAKKGSKSIEKRTAG